MASQPGTCYCGSSMILAGQYTPSILVNGGIVVLFELLVLWLTFCTLLFTGKQCRYHSAVRLRL